ncbi:aspartic proteinase CDR1-like [Impatiens glandulifera]|uniref:aspartic proteinase CDR1-like n=1 Tax=Impatiens glandulifera TaxID=253017 RepID=UPI001FB0AFF4|nr:aspartic proteinase CDR1-like [Impatiens glandulifera]
MKSNSSFLMFPLLILLIFSIPKSSFAHSGDGFTAELIHRDSPLSPFYNPSTTQYDRLSAALNRTISRQIFLKESFANKRSMRTHVLGYGLEFLMKVEMGTPPVTLFLVVDTGSSINWAKCIPCTKCSNKDRHIYNPKMSRTYRQISCKSPACRSLDNDKALPCGISTNGSVVDKSCPYFLVYGDGSSSKGSLAIETIGLGSNIVDGIVFGCSHELDGYFPGSGLVGLGIGNLSLVKQLGKSIGSRFSYCLSTGLRGTISFGEKSIPTSNPMIVSTPMVIDYPDTVYYLTLKGFTSANGSWIQFDKDVKEGNIIIDSGSPYTMLPSFIYQELEQTYKQKIRAKRVDDPKKISNLCFKTNSVSKFPSITAHFDGGANVVLLPTNTFVSTAKGVFCLNIVTTQFSPPVWGHLWQQNMLVGYDLEKKIIYFKPGCSN